MRAFSAATASKAPKRPHWYIGDPALDVVWCNGGYAACAWGLRRGFAGVSTTRWRLWDSMCESWTAGLAHGGSRIYGARDCGSRDSARGYLRPRSTNEDRFANPLPWPLSPSPLLCRRCTSNVRASTAFIAATCGLAKSSTPPSWRSTDTSVAVRNVPSPPHPPQSNPPQRCLPPSPSAIACKPRRAEPARVRRACPPADGGRDTGDGCGAGDGSGKSGCTNGDWRCTVGADKGCRDCGCG